MSVAAGGHFAFADQLVPHRPGKPKEPGRLKWRGESWRCLMDLDGLWSARLRYYVSHLWR
jgi:hypothetical protein